MSELYIPGGVADEEDKKGAKTLEVNYDPTEKDEECFFLIYNLNMQPSEAYGLENEHRRWIVGRTLMQKQMEMEMRDRARLTQQIMPNLRG